MKEEEISSLEAYYQNNESDSVWIEKLFEEEKNEPDLKHQLNRKWIETLDNPIPQIDLKHILYRIHFNINSKEKELHISKRRQLYLRFSKVAAILLFPFMALSIFLVINNIYEPQQFTEIIAPKGEKAKFILPDGSWGYLNSGSTLKYAYPFGKRRIVELAGESYFNVVHDKNIFTVQVENMKVEVHGTKFNVCAYDNDPDIITTLQEGSVSVVREIDGKELAIKPGQQAVFHKSDNQIVYRDVDVDLYVSWKDNMLRFKNAPFADVVKKMERWYDIKIMLDEQLKFSQYYTMTVKTESLREMLDLMAITAPMEYEIKEDIVYITFKDNMPMK
uniref:FecR family protein n=1 Tax=uncultured Draconibacterium sp. TaxID=1573823 RepID=UPI003217A19F